MVIFLRCLNISLLGPSDLAFLDLGNDFSLNWTLQISPQLSALVPTASSCGGTFTWKIALLS